MGFNSGFKGLIVFSVGFG